MAVNYNRTKSLKGLAVGTIVPWSGPLSGPSGIPKGWLACTGAGYSIDRYPELFEIIGYRYTAGADEANPSVTFNLPNLPGRSLGDYHPSHAADCGYTGNFASSLPTTADIPAEVTGVQSSNIDLKLSLNPVSNLRANITGMNLSNPTYVTTFGYVPRRLGDAHFGTHSHTTIELPSVRVSNTGIEECVQNKNPPDSCTEDDIYKSSNTLQGDDDLCVPKYDGGEHVGRGQNPYGTDRFDMARQPAPGDSGDRNYIRKGEDCVLYNETASQLQALGLDPTLPNPGELGDGNANWQGIYATTLMTNSTNFQTSDLEGHEHTTQTVRIDSSGVFTRETVRINTLSTGSGNTLNITPVDIDTEEILTITANVNTPSIQMLFIIKAY